SVSEAGDHAAISAHTCRTDTFASGHVHCSQTGSPACPREARWLLVRCGPSGDPTPFCDAPICGSRPTADSERECWCRRRALISFPTVITLDVRVFVRRRPDSGTYGRANVSASAFLNSIIVSDVTETHSLTLSTCSREFNRCTLTLASFKEHRCKSSTKQFV